MFATIKESSINTPTASITSENTVTVTDVNG